MREEDLRRLDFHRIKEELGRFLNSPATERVLKDLVPLTDRELILSEIALWEALKDTELKLHRFEDISPLLERSRIEGAYLSARDLLALLNVLKLIKEVRRNIGREAGSKPPLRELARKLHQFSSLENLIESSVDRRGFLKDEASEELLRIRKSIRGLEKEIMNRLESLLRRPDAEKVFTDKIITIRNNRYVVPVKSSQVKKVFGIVHGSSSSGYTTYVEPQFVVELNNDLTELKIKEEEETRKVLRRITSYVRDFSNKIEESFETLVKIDLLLAKCELGKKYGGRFPKQGDRVELIGAKHPLLALKDPSTVPVDILLKGRKGLILTGPNTGGKTVALKTLGLIVLMVQSAIPVPVAEGSTLPLFKDVFVDVGDEQSVEQNLSTFSYHTKNVAGFLPHTGSTTLVLLDELGAGTDPSEGSALGISILEYLKGKGAWVFVTTHHTPIKLYALRCDYYTPASVLFDRKTLKPLYKIAYNTVGESMAFEVARRCGLPEEIVARAMESMEDFGTRYADAMEKLSRYAEEYERKLLEIEKLKEELEEEKKRYESLRTEYEEMKRRGWKEVYREAKDYLRSLRERGEALLRRPSEKELEEFISSEEKRLAPPLSVEEVRVGDKVEFMGKKGKVLQVKGDRVFVAFEGMKVWVGREELKKVAGGGVIDLSGMDRESALAELERFIEEAWTRGLRSVKVFHGSLKKDVHDFLSRSDKIRFYREAYPNEGGAGVSIVFLRVSNS
ncbi:MAG TPA: endonuclease MutS2 [Aquificaceae bacterium]|nr:endonuclease MutS2 [Aquificaceae bacterium]